MSLKVIHGISRTRGRGRVLGVEPGSMIVWLAVLTKRNEVIGRIKFDARRVWKEPNLPEIGAVLNYEELGDTVTKVEPL